MRTPTRPYAKMTFMFHHLKTTTILVALLFVQGPALQAKPGDKVYQEGFLSVKESHDSLELPPGYSLELVLSEPEIEEPVMVAWDGNGAMYVVQMMTYMQNLNAKGEKDPKSRITRHVDTNGDGTYDQHTVYADGLVLPRFVLPLDDRVMVGLTDTLDLWTYRDTTGDGVADEKIKVYEGGRRGGNMEHQPSGLLWGLDNWLYLTYESQRYRFTNGKLEVQKIPRGSGQWGLTQDDWGRLYFSDAGGEKPAIDYQQPIAYGSLNLSDQQTRDFHTVYPIAEVPDAQGGLKRIGANGGVNNFTGCGGQSIFRGDRLPEDMYGDLIIPEAVGRLIRRAKVERNSAKTVLRNAYSKTEFIRTRDVNFRPVWTATTPGGQMMIVDMHRGIIQQGNWTKKGSYLRGVIEKWGLQKNIGKGRIYRLVHKDFKAGPQPKMLDESTKELAAHLSHPNGWWRDTAQKLILLRDDRELLVPELEKMVRTGKSEFGRLHALWTLEGMDQVKPEILVAAFNDPSSMVRTSAIRVAEPFFSKGDETVITAMTESFPKDAEMVVQMLNSLAASQASDPALIGLGEKLEASYGKAEVVQAVTKARDALADEIARAALQEKQGADFAKAMAHGQTIYRQLCFSCHGEDGKGAEMAGSETRLAPPFTGSTRLLGVTGEAGARVLLNGLIGEVDGKHYPGMMVPMATNDDQWIADVLTYVRNSFGNTAPMVTPDLVASIRKQHGKRTTPWTVEELMKNEPTEFTYQKGWKLKASHNEKQLKLAFDGDDSTAYSTGTRMKAGMWIQVELPKKTRVSALILDAGKAKKDFPETYSVQVSDNGKDWSTPIAAGNGKKLLEITFPPVEANYLRVYQNGAKRQHWSIAEMKILGKAL